MEYVLLVKPPSEGWVVWAWDDNGDGYLVEEGGRLKALGYEVRIFLNLCGV